MAEQMKQEATGKAIPAGYKQTEVGVIPEDWVVANLSAITEHSRPISYGIVQTGPLIVNGVPCIRVVDISDGKIKRDNLITTTKEISNSYRRTILQDGDLIIPLRGKVGEVGLVDGDLVGANLTRGVALIAPQKDYTSEFIKQYLSNRSSADRLLSSMNGSALQEITIETLRRFSIALPIDVKEQTAIANVLSDSDALIDALEQLIAKKQAIKNATMQQLLTGRTRLPAFALRPDGTPKGYKPSELGDIPEDWEVSRLGELAHIKTGSKNNQDKVSDGNYPFFVRSENIERINSFSYDCEAILIPGEGGVGSIYHYIVGKFDAHQRVYVIREFIRCLGKYVYFQMKNSFGSHAMENSVKATVDSLRLPTFECFTLLLPSIEEQTAIATILSDMDNELQALTQKLEKARALKQGMMQQLLTGKIRLPLAAGA
ncbi:restriction endonuclease subunit S [Aeromonas veronii]|uniref:restriction endonuclease subunit S n=1 Tax=Aeromonas veronii TaxID=654 RepID=UPI003004C102